MATTFTITKFETHEICTAHEAGRTIGRLAMAAQEEAASRAAALYGVA